MKKYAKNNVWELLHTCAQLVIKRLWKIVGVLMSHIIVAECTYKVEELSHILWPFLLFLLHGRIKFPFQLISWLHSSAWVWEHRGWLMATLHFPFLTLSFSSQRANTQCFMDMKGKNKKLDLLKGIIDGLEKAKTWTFNWTFPIAKAEACTELTVIPLWVSLVTNLACSACSPVIL